jgi:hypothetical protein
MMSAKSSVIPPKKKLEKFVTATAVKVKKAVKITPRMEENTPLAVTVDTKAEIVTTRLVIDPSTSPATTSRIGSLLRSRLCHSVASL